MAKIRISEGKNKPARILPGRGVPRRSRMRVFESALTRRDSTIFWIVLLKVQSSSVASRR